MPTGKGRSTKRSSGICSSSTLIFIALSALFLWFITSNTFAPPRSITNNTPTHISSSSSDQNSRKPTLDEVRPALETHDNHDPIKSVEKKEGDDSSSSHDSDKSDADSSSTTSEDEAGLEQNHEQQMKLANEVQKTAEVIQTETKIGDNNQGSNISDEEEKKTEALQETEKQIALETQTSEESSITHAQEVEQIKEEHQQDQKRVFDNQENNANSQNEITEEDEKNRVREYQKQEDDQIKQSTDPNGATSKDQIQHDEQQPANPTEDDAKKTGESKKNQEIKKQHPKNKKETKPTIKHKKPNQEKGSSKKIEKGSKKQWSTQADQSQNQKDRGSSSSSSDTSSTSDVDGDADSSINGYEWQLCNTTAGADYIPCLDNEKVIAKIHNRKHHEHRERHCPEDPPTCLVPLPNGYKTRIDWPQSRDKIWYHNVPHTLLAEVKGHQNWVKVVGEFLTFPGGGTQFIHGALHYIDFIQEAVADIAWGKHSRVVLDVGCGVASFGGYLFDRDVITMSFAPKDEHEAQVQFALERGIPAISAVMGSQRLPFPSRVFDVVHCARCRVPWHADGGALLLELNRVLRPGGYFVWSATPVYQKLEEDVQIWNEMSNLTVAMCWELVTIKKDKLNSIGAAIYQKPESNDCYEKRKHNQPPMCKNDDDPNAAWYVPLQSCMHRVPVQENERGSQWPEEWPERLQKPPYWLNASDQKGIYGKPAAVDFTFDFQNWQKIVTKSYMNGLGINWSNVRNVMDMRAVYGGFAAALKDMKLWVMNVVNTDAPDTLPIIYERGLIGMYHDWCESFSTYPRSYDLLHADHLFSKIKDRCKLVVVMAEVDRIVRPGGSVIVRDEARTIDDVEDLLKSLKWKVTNKVPENQEIVLSAQKSDWRPDSYAAPS